MKVVKLGKIELELEQDWQVGGVITPTPFVLDDDTIRVFTGFRDAEGISRIGYIDLDSNDPRSVKHISNNPVLDIGEDGCFDDNGMIIGDIKSYKEKIYLFYIGFQMVKKAKFLAYSGLAISENGGLSFERYSQCPILDRADNALTIKAVHSINNINGQLYIYYALGSDWEVIGGKPYPKYEIYQSKIKLDSLETYDEKLCVVTKGSEYRIGKPTVYENEDGFIMIYTRGRKDDLSYYQPGLAFSTDGERWIRDDNLYPTLESYEDWDNLNISYPKIIQINDGRQFLFYSGNSMGAAGFGVAELIEGKIIYKQEITD